MKEFSPNDIRMVILLQNVCLHHEFIHISNIAGATRLHRHLVSKETGHKNVTKRSLSNLVTNLDVGVRDGPLVVFGNWSLDDGF